MKYSIKPSRQGEAIIKLLNSMKTRAGHFRGHLVFKAASSFLEDVKSKIPAKKEFETYKRSLVVSKIQGADKGKDAYAVHIKTNTRGVKKVDTARTLIYVRVKENRLLEAKDSAILEKYSPWTVNSIPFMPKTIDAVITYRKSTPSAVTRAEKTRQRDRYKWMKELREVGVRKIQKKETEIGKVKDLPDVALQALRLEFGIGNQKAIAHWRPAQRDLVQHGLKHIFKADKAIEKTFTDPGFSGWSGWPEKTQQSISMGEARKFAGFQDKVKIKIG